MNQANRPNYAEFLIGALVGMTVIPLRLYIPLWWISMQAGEWTDLWSDPEATVLVLGVSCIFWLLSSPALVLTGGFIGAGLATLVQAVAKKGLTKSEATGVGVVSGIAIGILAEGVLTVICPTTPVWSDPVWLQTKIAGTVVLAVIGGFLGFAVSSIQE